jgi:hypothetical protein
VEKAEVHGVCASGRPGAHRALGREEQAGVHVGGHLGQLQWVCGRLGHKLVLVGGMADLFQVTRAQRVQLQVIVGAQDHGHMVGGNHRQLLQLKLPQLAQPSYEPLALADPSGAAAETRGSLVKAGFMLRLIGWLMV